MKETTRFNCLCVVSENVFLFKTSPCLRDNKSFAILKWMINSKHKVSRILHTLHNVVTVILHIWLIRIYISDEENKAQTTDIE